jgi:hypothetical protein
MRSRLWGKTHAWGTCARLTGVCDWSTDAASALLPSLIGHLVFGAVTACVFLVLQNRYLRWLLLDTRNRNAREMAHTSAGYSSAGIVVPGIGVGGAAADTAGVNWR